MRMKEEWNDLTVKKIALVGYVAPNMGKLLHKDRLYHGFVLNDAETANDYCFSDGTVLHTEGGSLFYLPKHSFYSIKRIQSGGCYFINFDADIEDVPFCVNIKNYEKIKKEFKNAADEWYAHDTGRMLAAMISLYRVVRFIKGECAQAYMPNERYGLLSPAMNRIAEQFTDPQITVASLSACCGISEVYFRKIFAHRFGVSPKEYIIQRRIEYAKQLLTQGEFDVLEIARLCGYTEPCHFSREFKKRVGVSPKEYQ